MHDLNYALQESGTLFVRPVSYGSRTKGTNERDAAKRSPSPPEKKGEGVEGKFLKTHSATVTSRRRNVGGIPASSLLHNSYGGVEISNNSIPPPPVPLPNPSLLVGTGGKKERIILSLTCCMQSAISSFVNPPFCGKPGGKGNLRGGD